LFEKFNPPVLALVQNEKRSKRRKNWKRVNLEKGELGKRQTWKKANLETRFPKKEKYLNSDTRFQITQVSNYSS
jgi:hypothetical protein